MSPVPALLAGLACLLWLAPAGASQGGTREHGAGEHGAGEHGAGEHGAGEHGTGKHRDARGTGWIGAIVPPYPDGTRETQGTCIGRIDAPGGICGHAVAVIDEAQGGLRTVLALRGARHFGERPLWQVVDALEPDALADRSVEVAVAICQAGGNEDGHVLALVRRAETEWLPALQAWRFDTTAGRLHDIPAASVRCLNEGFGYDG